jgi:Uma2 family endonuclease
MGVSDPSILPIRPLRRDEYDRMVDLGMFQDERIELIEGLLVQMSPQGAPHAHAVRQLTRIFGSGLRERALLQVQSPWAATDDSEPEPDIAIVPLGDYSTTHPDRALLVVEVADESLRKDRLVKVRLYARAGVPEYWIVNLPQRTVEVYRLPGPEGYAEVTSRGPEQTISPGAFPDVVIAVGELVPLA